MNKKIQLYMFSLCSVFAFAGTNTFAEIGEAGSETEERAVLVDLELKNSQGEWVKLYTGSEYLEVIGSGPGTVAGTTEITKPAAGTYTHSRLTLRGERVKAKIVIGGTSYYTTEETKKRNEQNNQNAETFTLTTNENEYGAITVDDLFYQDEFELLSPLDVSIDKDFTLVWVLKADAGVKYENTSGEEVSASNISFISRRNEMKAIVFEDPYRLIHIPLLYQSNSGDLLNTATLIINREGNLIGGDCVRADNKAINCGFIVSGSLQDVEDNGASATFSVTYSDSDGNGGQYTISGSYDCGSDSFGSLNVVETGSVSASYDNSHTLQTTGTPTCQTFQQ